MTAPALPPVPAIHSELLATLRRDFAAANYTVDGIDTLLSGSARGALERENPIPAVRELDAIIENTEHPAWRTALLTRVFTLGGTATGEHLSSALPSLGADGCLTLGLIIPCGPASDTDAEVRATVDLRPYAATDDDGEILWWIASDLGELATGKALAGEHVLGIGGATSTLIAITPREHVETALDLGCGCGIQALHAARHARRVVATDISERALAITRFNVALNESTLPEGHTIEARLGSMLEPVDGEKFDLIVSNPPFVITPRSVESNGAKSLESATEKWTYRDGGQVGDAIVESLVTALHAHLNPGGTAAMLANWEIPMGAAWSARPQQWLDESPANSIIVQRDTEDPASYAATWMRDGGVIERDARWAPMMHAWLDDFASRNVEAIGFGHVLLRMPSPPEKATPETEPFHVFSHIESTGSGPLGPRYREMLHAAQQLAGVTDDELRHFTFERADDVVERRHFTPGAEDPMLIDLVQGGGFGRTIQVDTHTAGIVGVLTGEYPLGTLLDAYGALLEQAGQGEAREAAEEQITSALRDLVTWGFVRISAPQAP